MNLLTTIAKEGRGSKKPVIFPVLGKGTYRRGRETRNRRVRENESVRGRKKRRRKGQFLRRQGNIGA